MARFLLVLVVVASCALGAVDPARAHAGSAAAHGGLAWSLAQPVAVAAIVALAFFARGFVTLRRRGRRDHAGLSHAAPFVGGVLLSVFALMSPLDAAAEYLLSAHMLQHVLLGDAAPALLALGLRGPLCFFVVPAAVLRAVSRTPWLRRPLGFIARPVPSFAAWALTLAIWHVPPVYEAAQSHALLHDLEHASFVGAGLLVWWQLVDPARRRELDVRGRLIYAGSLIAAAHLFIHPVLFSGAVVYSTYESQTHRLLGLSPLADQHWAGVVMTFEQVATLGILALLLVRPAALGRLRRRGAAVAVRPTRPAS